MTIGLEILFLFLLLLAAGMPVGFALGTLGMTGLFFFGGGWPALQSAGMIAWSSANDFTLTSIPLFILMGDIVMRVGFGKDLYDAATAWLRKLPGGLGIATIFSNAVFASVSGSSAAACASMSLLAIPEMERWGYKKRLIYGTMTAGGSLAILIPPSVILIVYGSFTEESVGKLFLAGFIPGIILVILFALTIYLWTRLDPEAAPIPDVPLTFKEKLGTLKGVWSFIALFVICLGTIYAGIATPTEAAGLGASGSMLLALAAGRLTWQILKESLLSTVEVTCMLLFLILGGLILSNFLLFSDVPRQLIELASSLGLPRWGILIMLYLIYFLLGCFMDGLTMIVITLPIVAPLISALGLPLLWFGIVVVILVEISQLTPPVGMNLYIITNISKGKLEDVTLGSLPFILPMAIMLVLITVFPSIVTFVPDLIMP